MGPPASHRRMTYRESVVREAAAQAKHEWVEGEVYAMAGPSAEHSAVAGELRRLLANALDGRPDGAQCITNPLVVAEVLSPTTEKWDRGGKAQYYAPIPSLRHYVILRHDAVAVEVLSRGADGALSRADYGPGDTVVLDGIGVRLSVDEGYAAWGRRRGLRS